MEKMMQSGLSERNWKRGLGLTALLICLLAAPWAKAQETGILEGKLINRTDPGSVPSGVDLEVVSLDGGMGIIRTAKTDASGAFRIEKLPVNLMLMLRAIYKDASYNRQFGFDAEGKARVELDIYDATESMKDIRVDEYRMVFQLAGDQLQSLDTIVISNETDPPRTLMNSAGNFRFSKAPGITALPQIRITAPGSSMPVTQSALESADGDSYYTLYPIRPGRTTIEVFQRLPYETRQYTYVREFPYASPAIEIGVIPMDMEVSGTGLTPVRTDASQNLAVYRTAPIEAGARVEWVFSGGSPVALQEDVSAEPQSNILSMPNPVGEISGILVPLLLLGFILVLWYAINRGGDEESGPEFRKNRLKDRRELLNKRLAELEQSFRKKSMGQKEYFSQKEEIKQMLSRIALLLKKNPG
jgi:hypothetical protein